jgi:hypothetical protein
MKNLFTAAVFCLFLSSFCNAQMGRGAWLLGGNLSLNGSGDDRTLNPSPSGSVNKNINIGIRPAAGVFVTDRLAVGLSPSWSYSRREIADLNYYLDRNSNFGLGLFARYYLPLSAKWTLFGDLSGPGYQSGKSRNIQTTPTPQGSATNRFEVDSRYSGYTLGAFLGFGAAYFITPKIGIEATVGSIGYGFSVRNVNNEFTPGTESEQTSRSNSGGISFSPENFSIGVRFYLGNKQAE